jgi:hypothetical protein
MISALCLCLLVFALLADEPSPDRLARRRIRAWKRERLVVSAPNRRRL